MRWPPSWWRPGSTASICGTRACSVRIQDAGPPSGMRHAQVVHRHRQGWQLRDEFPGAGHRGGGTVCFVTCLRNASMQCALPAEPLSRMRHAQVVIDIDGDGSFMMNPQELATIAVEGLDVKIVVLNNQHLGMVVQWEDRFYKANRAHTYLGRRVSAAA